MGKKQSPTSPKGKGGIDALLNQFEDELSLTSESLMEDTMLRPKKSHQIKVNLALEVNVIKHRSV